MTEETIMHCCCPPALPITLSMRLERTEIKVMKMRPEESRNGEEGCWAEVEPGEGGAKGDFLWCLFNCLIVFFVSQNLNQQGKDYVNWQ